jgi:hypothetical protein
MADEAKPKERKKRVEGEPKPKKATAPAAGETAPPPEAAAPPKPHTLSVKIPKLQKKDKSRLPRRQKKALQKAAAAKGGV